jgi:hypothetical protein
MSENLNEIREELKDRKGENREQVLKNNGSSGFVVHKFNSISVL